MRDLRLIVQDRKVQEAVVPGKSNWRSSEGKYLLQKDLYEGEIPLSSEGMSPEEVYVLRPEFARDSVSFERFKRNLENLRKSIREERAWSTRDLEALTRDRGQWKKPSHNHRGEPRWEGSEAERCLKEDVARNFNTDKAAMSYYDEREVYKLYPRKVIRKHVEQEIRKTKFLKQMKKRAEKGKDWMQTLRDNAAPPA